MASKAEGQVLNYLVIIPSLACLGLAQRISLEPIPQEAFLEICGDLSLSND